jgi:alanine racemase
VGYNATWTANGTRRIATVPVGYADGYRRHLSNLGEGVLHGRRCPVVGRVSMDMTMLDVTDVPCNVGDIITLLGTSDGVTLTTDAIAERGALSPYELLVGLRLRLPRLYRDTP